MAHKGNLTLKNAGIPSKLSSPTVTAIAPANGPAAGGTAVTITGTGFKKGANPQVTIDGVACTGETVTSATTITATTGAHAAGGPFDVVVTNAAGGDGHSFSGTGAALFTYDP